MSDLLVIGFGNGADAVERRAALAKLQAQYLIAMEDAVVATRNTNAKVQLHQPVNPTTAGPVGGATWGMLSMEKHRPERLHSSSN